MRSPSTCRCSGCASRAARCARSCSSRTSSTRAAARCATCSRSGARTGSTRCSSQAWRQGTVLAGLSAGRDVLVRGGHHALERAARAARRARAARGLAHRPRRRRARAAAGVARRRARRRAARRLGARRRRRPAVPRAAHWSARSARARARARSASTRSPASSCAGALAPELLGRRTPRRARRRSTRTSRSCAACTACAGGSWAAGGELDAAGARGPATTGRPPADNGPLALQARARAADAAVSRENVDHDHAEDGCVMEQQLKIKQTATGYWTVQRGEVHLRGAMTRRGAEAERELMERLRRRSPRRAAAAAAGEALEARRGQGRTPLRGRDLVRQVGRRQRLPGKAAAARGARGRRGSRGRSSCARRDGSRASAAGSRSAPRSPRAARGEPSSTSAQACPSPSSSVSRASTVPSRSQTCDSPSISVRHGTPGIERGLARHRSHVRGVRHRHARRGAPPARAARAAWRAPDRVFALDPAVHRRGAPAQRHRGPAHAPEHELRARRRARARPCGSAPTPIPTSARRCTRASRSGVTPAVVAAAVEVLLPGGGDVLVVQVDGAVRARRARTCRRRARRARRGSRRRARSRARARAA